jgi:homocitrate synthase NifV
MEKKPKIYLIDVTNRDGVQTSRICLSKLQKTMFEHVLQRNGGLPERVRFSYNEA